MISLANHNPELLKEWNYKKNEIDPHNISYGTNKKVWWKCSKCGNEWQATVYNRFYGTGCPLCYKNRTR